MCLHRCNQAGRFISGDWYLLYTTTALPGAMIMTRLSESESASSLTPRGILETVVYGDDLKAARQFYEGVLGLSLVSHEDGRHLFFRLAGGMLLVFNAQRTREETVRVNDQVIPRHGALGQSHMAFQVDFDQLAEIKSKLIEERIPIESQIDWPAGGHSIYCRDPAGNSIEFATRSLWYE